MMSWLMEVQRQDPLLTEDDVLHSCIILLNAGHETTQTLICNTLTTLLDLPQELAFLRANPQSMKTALEEGLRYNGPLKGTIASPAPTWSCTASASARAIASCC
jgi:cytochrome P450